MTIYINQPHKIEPSIYSHLDNKDSKKIFITYLTFNKTTLEWYGGETKLYKYLKGYAGSGTSILEHFKEWKEKLGDSWRDNFICLLDECYESRAESKSRERELVNDDTRDELCINILNGGGGWDYGDEYPEEVRQKMSNSINGKNHSKQTKQKMSNTRRDKRFDHLIKMLEYDEYKQPNKRKHQCLLCKKILSQKIVIINHLKSKHINEYKKSIFK